MDSIPKTASFRLTRNGLIVTNQTITNFVGFTDETRAERKENDIKGFSKSSRLRFRRLLASVVPKQNLEPWGCCLTIPGEPITQERAAKLWHSWSRNNCRRSFADYPMIWRVELQTRKQPHWHIVIFIPKGKKGALVRVEYADQWRSFIRQSLKVKNSIPWDFQTDCGFEKYGVKWQSLKTISEGTSKYLAPTFDHETKHKQEQLGWIGRQWGVVNRQELDFDDGDTVHLYGASVGRIIHRFKALQDSRRANGGEYVGAGVGEHMRLPSVLFGREADYLAGIVRGELANYEL